MGFYLYPIGQTVYTDTDGEEHIIDSSELVAGTPVLVAGPSFDEDDSEYDQTFTASKAHGPFVWVVNYSAGFGPTSINEVSFNPPPKVEVEESCEFAVANG